jgi:hypothetical protein
MYFQGTKTPKALYIDNYRVIYKKGARGLTGVWDKNFH